MTDTELIKLAGMIIIAIIICYSVVAIAWMLFTTLRAKKNEVDLQTMRKYFEGANK